MHEELWAGVELKIEHAAFFLQKMSDCLQPPEGTNWQLSFYACLDAFLAMTRSVPEIIQCCFGHDTSFQMKDWFKDLSDDEKSHRKQFAVEFNPDHKNFRDLPLSATRNTIFHRTGVAPVNVRITGRFGVTYTGKPIKDVPAAESRNIVAGDDPSLQWAATPPPVSVRPAWTDFTIDGKPLFPECQDYLEEARKLLNEARRISQQVHGNDSLTPPA
jgi:hypothetical protein